MLHIVADLRAGAHRLRLAGALGVVGHVAVVRRQAFGRAEHLENAETAHGEQHHGCQQRGDEAGRGFFDPDGIVLFHIGCTPFK